MLGNDMHAARAQALLNSIEREATTRADPSGMSSGRSPNSPSGRRLPPNVVRGRRLKRKQTVFSVRNSFGREGKGPARPNFGQGTLSGGPKASRDSLDTSVNGTVSYRRTLLYQNLVANAFGNDDLILVVYPYHDAR
jgi:hypothetical protein